MTPQEFSKAVQDEIRKYGTLKLSEPQKTELKEVFDSVLEEKIRPLKADMLEIANENKRIKDALSTGKGLQKNDNVLSRDELKTLLPAKLESTSLREVVELTEGRQ